MTTALPVVSAAVLAIRWHRTTRGERTGRISDASAGLLESPRAYWREYFHGRAAIDLQIACRRGVFNRSPECQLSY